MRKILVLCILTFVGSLQAGEPILSCDVRLESALKMVESLPDASYLFQEAERQGGVHIQASVDRQFGGYWDEVRHTVFVDVAQPLSGQVAALLFEMHNMLASREFQRLIAAACHGEIDKAGYVDGVERIEYRNSLRAHALVEQGKRSGIFPQETFLPHFSDYETYLYWQQRGGHSQWIAQRYDEMAPWRFQ